MAELAGLLAAPLGGEEYEAYVDRYCRMLRDLLPPGRLWRLDEGSVLHRFLCAAAEELARVHQRALDLLREADPGQAAELLEEWEALHALVAGDATPDARRAAVVARRIKRQRVRPADWQATLAGLLSATAEQIEIIERKHADAVAMQDDQEIYRWFVFRDPAIEPVLDPGFNLGPAQQIVDDYQHSDTKGHVIMSKDFLCDDPYSLCDRDILGV